MTLYEPLNIFCGLKGRKAVEPDFRLYRLLLALEQSHKWLLPFLLHFPVFRVYFVKSVET
ncbi:hypothetical protein KSD_54050 [Ktedonobacter sp. SOSP1-85]|nr:hypothetical protein KSD_54050 [Ktedonobacter sp. SOSP1-85]